MAYGNYYYPNYQPNTTGNTIIWVQGEAGAKSYLVAPGTTVQLWDSESQTIYLKSADQCGMPSIKILDYTIRDTVATQNKVVATNEYATVDELMLLRKQVEELSELVKEGKVDE